MHILLEGRTVCQNPLKSTFFYLMDCLKNQCVRFFLFGKQRQMEGEGKKVQWVFILSRLLVVEFFHL